MTIEKDFISFVNEDNNSIGGKEKKWKILVVDDDEEVHSVTKMVLEDLVFQNKGIKIISAYSESEAVKNLQEHPDIAIILLDVVMEEEDSGLRLVKYIRQIINNYLIRIILRTGQPGQAPEEKIILEYDINDYKEKTELTVQKLYTTIISSLRSYRDLMIIENGKRGLEKIIESNASIFERQNIKEITSGVLSQLKAILCMRSNNKNINTCGFAATKICDDNILIVEATGKYQPYIGMQVSSLENKYIQDLISFSSNEKSNMYNEKDFVLYLKNKSGIENLVYMDGIDKVDKWDIDLIEVFAANVSIAVDNLYLNNEIIDTQKEIIFILGEIAEARSRETGNHVKRVAEYCKILASGYGLNDEEAEVLRLAAPLHDIGKLAIPDNILMKPGKLTEDEFDVIKTHTTIGYDMLKNSQRDILKAAILITLQHHEKYDGSGYPEKLKSDDIHIFGRITALADVFDALGSNRIYKKAWELKDILDYIRREKGYHFDPKLVDIFFERLDDILAVRNKFMDRDCALT